MKVYRLTAPADCEGRTTQTVGYFAEFNDALSIHMSGYKNQERGGPGDPAHYIERLEVHESVLGFVSSSDMSSLMVDRILNDEEADGVHRRRGLAKLTKRERSALNLGDGPKIKTSPLT